MDRDRQKRVQQRFWQAVGLIKQDWPVTIGMASKTSTSVTIRGVEEGTGGLTREMEGYQPLDSVLCYQQLAGTQDLCQHGWVDDGY